jgi:hypothetical protein
MIGAAIPMMKIPGGTIKTYELELMIGHLKTSIQNEEKKTNQ